MIISDTRFRKLDAEFTLDTDSRISLEEKGTPGISSGMSQRPWLQLTSIKFGETGVVGWKTIRIDPESQDKLVEMILEKRKEITG